MEKTIHANIFIITIYKQILERKKKKTQKDCQYHKVHNPLVKAMDSETQDQGSNPIARSFSRIKWVGPFSRPWLTLVGPFGLSWPKWVSPFFYIYFNNFGLGAGKLKTLLGAQTRWPDKKYLCCLVLLPLPLLQTRVVVTTVTARSPWRGHTAMHMQQPHGALAPCTWPRASTVAAHCFVRRLPLFAARQPALHADAVDT